MELTVIREDDELSYIALAGQLDVTGVKEIEPKFVEHTSARGKPTLIDISRVTFMASLGMRMLLRCSRALKGTGGKMVLLKPQPLVEQALKVACLDQVFGIEQDEARAMEALKAQ